MHPTTKEIIDFLVVTVLLKYVFVHGFVNIVTWVIKKLWKKIHKRLIKSERDLAYFIEWYNHYKR